MSAHNASDGLGRFNCMVKRDPGSVMVQYVRLNGAMEEVTADESKVSVDCRGSASEKGPGLGWIVGQREISMLEECYGNCKLSGVAL